MATAGKDEENELNLCLLAFTNGKYKEI